MRNAAVMLICLFALSLDAQVMVEVKPRSKRILPHEPMPVDVEIKNFSGRTLTLGESKEWLTFIVEGPNQLLVPKAEDPEVQGVFELQASTKGTKRVDLVPHFDLSTPGFYKVSAMIRVPQLGQEVTSAPVMFSVAPGVTLWDLTFGAPSSPRHKDLPRLRKYSLIQANQVDELKLYFRLSNSSGTEVYQIYPLGRIVSFSKVEQQLDRESNLHVLYQTGAREFLYYMISPAGEVAVRYAYNYTSTRPVLAAAPDGEITVSGGARRLSRYDIDVPLKNQIARALAEEKAAETEASETSDD